MIKGLEGKKYVGMANDGTRDKTQMEVLAASGLPNLDSWEEGMTLTEMSSIGGRVQISVGNLRAPEHIHRRHSANK